MANQIMHIEIAGRAGPALEDFYGSLFGWSVERKEAGGHAYGWVTPAPAEACTVGIRHEPEGRAETVLYVGVDDLPGSVARAVELGASVRIPPVQGSGMMFALLSDPEGNPFGLLQQER